MAKRLRGEGMKTVGINLSDEMNHELERRAASMGVSKTIYCKTIFRQWLESGSKLTLSE